MTPHELYQAGKLKEAIAAALDEVKKHPTDTDRRGKLCELLLFGGDWERADKQLDTMIQQDPSSVIGASLLRQLLRAETARQQFFTEGRVPEFLVEPTEVLKRHLEAAICVREGKPGEAARVLEQAEAGRPHVAGVADGTPFDDFRDLDDLTASFLEILTSTGKYYWIPTETVERIEFRRPERPIDLLWRRALLAVKDGPDGEVYFPTIYAGTPQDDQLRLGRGTDWCGESGVPVRGQGLRTYLVGEEDRTILQLGTIEFGHG